MPHPSIFLESWILDERSEEKISFAARESERRCKSSPLGSRSKAPENFGYFAFLIAQNIAFLALSQQSMTKTYTRNQHFESFGVLAWDSKPVYRLQFKIAPDTAVLIRY